MAHDMVGYRRRFLHGTQKTGGLKNPSRSNWASTTPSFLTLCGVGQNQWLPN